MIRTLGIVLPGIMVLSVVTGPVALLLLPRLALRDRPVLIRVRYRRAAGSVVAGFVAVGLALAVPGAVRGRWWSCPGFLYWPVPQLLPVFLGVLVTGVLVWRMGQRSATPQERIGLRLAGLGTLAGAWCTLVVIAALVGRSVGVQTPTVLVSRVSRPLEQAAVLLVVTGAVLVAAPTARARMEACRQLRALLPIWRLMQAEFPGVVLYCPAGRASVFTGLAELELRLYRSIIETRDGMLELSRYVTADVVEDIDEFLRGAGEVDDVDACAEACWIALALRRRRAGAGTVPAGSVHRIAGGDSVAAEATWLIRVSRMLAGSPVPERFAVWWEART